MLVEAEAGKVRPKVLTNDQRWEIMSIENWRKCRQAQAKEQLLHQCESTPNDAKRNSPPTQGSGASAKRQWRVKEKISLNSGTDSPVRTQVRLSAESPAQAALAQEKKNSAGCKVCSRWSSRPWGANFSAPSGRSCDPEGRKVEAPNPPINCKRFFYESSYRPDISKNKARKYFFKQSLSYKPHESAKISAKCGKPSQKKINKKVCFTKKKRLNTF
jgi:hypothetical protein